MTTGVTGPGRASIEDKTLRQRSVVAGPSAPPSSSSAAFVVYATWRAFSGVDYYASPYLSPFYSPCLGDCVEGASDFGQPFAWFPFSAALIILMFPLGFRMTCYYYRKAYYRALLARARLRAGSPSPTLRYSGESPAPADPQQRRTATSGTPRCWSR